ncbi:RsmE family RNA methyltransferase [Spirochaeta africana]|uniref:Ribosomal RNA small subunit methyltransferase E n=1 Tax=Spirochaeta africana (strain ATCC 700263 / DSM 8902 / Z-7692) TaxID=889378 RepID=H9UMQ8_SPIAZ|nr:RsmE family RNA methyltransferase [Spirochaeta africana]AFG38801.1 RNA methyltransferase, RsmE family [Spirochaeta africana DSM 8902]
MKQFMLPADCPSRLVLEGNDFHYLHHVRRLKEGDSFAGIDPAGNRYHITIERVAGESLAAAVLPAGPILTELPELQLFQCVPKGGKFDDVVRMATEAGAASITPVLSDRTIVRIGGDDAEKKRRRWQRVLQEAVQQSGAPRVPRLGTPIALKELLQQPDLPEVMLFFHQAPLAPVPLHQYCSGSPRAIGLCIGPEGGFSPGEVQAMQAARWSPGYLGPWVLRTEHAGMYALAAVQTILLERAYWNLKNEAQTPPLQH